MPNQPIVPNQLQPFVQGDLGNTLKYLLSGVVLHQAFLQINNAQILTFYNSPVTIVAAPGANKINIPITCFCDYDFTAGAYGTTTNASWITIVGSFFSAYLTMEFQLTLTSRKFVQISTPNLLLGTATPSPGLVQYAVDDSFDQTTNMINKPILVRDGTSGSNYTGGNAANTAKFYLIYVTLNLTTGMFE